MPSIRTEGPQDGPHIEALLDHAFGTSRLARPSYRLREGLQPVHDLCFVAEAEGRILGTIRHWAVRIGDMEPALLLGPIAVDPAHERCGIGGLLVRTALERAAAEGHAIMVAVGALSYLGRFGFTSAARYGITLPGLTDSRRLLALALAPGALDGVEGAIARLSPEAASCRP
ncbi:MAG: N-acetyltransferase [Rhodospirillaceae bacterium]|nr:N-acetyltransferase [Rhodospirillaceae bacterium]